MPGAAEQNFGFADYWRMLVKRGPRLPLSYFLNTHLFDILNKTDTHVWLPKEKFKNAPENFEHGVLYMSSWTSEVKRSFETLAALTRGSDDFTFIDIGSGKGKVVLLWKQLLARTRSRQRTIGIDYYDAFIKTSTLNHQKMFGGPGEFLLSDATKLRYSSFGKKLIVYLYNPFNAEILGKVLRQIDNEEVFVIYNNPVHAGLLLDHGFALVSDHNGWHPNCQTKIYKRVLNPTL